MDDIKEIRKHIGTRYPIYGSELQYFNNPMRKAWPKYYTKDGTVYQAEFVLVDDNTVMLTNIRVESIPKT